MRRWLRRFLALSQGRGETVPPPRLAWNGRPRTEMAAAEPGVPDYSTLIVEFPVGGSMQAPASEHRPI